MLTNKQIKKLKALANHVTIKYQIGKVGINIDVINLLNHALKAHELIKVYFNKSILENQKALTEEIIKNTQSILVTKIGHMIVLYKENKDKKNRIIL